WLSYGSVTVRMKSGVAPGLVVSAILINQEGDEQDFELTGGHPGGRVAEGNYYYDGILEYNVNKRESPEYPLTEKFNDYTLSWLPDRMDWSINGNTYYTKLRNDTWDPQMRAFRFPYRTMKFQMGMWDAAQGEPSTRAWAGGYIDWKA
ncbi:concanavalin A-like lectin/glucanase, partial [Ramicandelaber brevisporus]